MQLVEYLEREIAECTRRLRVIERQHRIDMRYADASDADRLDVAYYRCQVELQAVEQRHLSDRRAVLEKWLGVAAQPGFQGVVPPGET